jgi:hypothetical protein
MTVVRTHINGVCDDSLGDCSENVCNGCLLPVEIHDLDRQDLTSSSVDTVTVLSDQGEELTNFRSHGENKCDRVTCDGATARNFSQGSNSFWNSKWPDVLLPHSADDHSCNAVNISHTVLYNADVPQDFVVNADDASGGEILQKTISNCNDMSETALHNTVVSYGGHEQNQSLPCIVVKMEEDKEKNEEKEWSGVVNGDGQCNLCSNNSADTAQNQISDCLLNNGENWENLMVKQQKEVLNSSLGCSAQVTSHLEQKVTEIGRVKGSRNIFLQANSSRNVSSSFSTPNDTNYRAGGSALAIVPSQNGR